MFTDVGSTIQVSIGPEDSSVSTSDSFESSLLLVGHHLPMDWDLYTDDGISGATHEPHLENSDLQPVSFKFIPLLVLRRGLELLPYATSEVFSRF